MTGSSVEQKVERDELRGYDHVFAHHYPVARKTHWCTTCDHPVIKAGDRYRYARGTASDVGPGIHTFRECRECAERYERPFPEAVPDAG